MTNNQEVRENFKNHVISGAKSSSIVNRGLNEFLKPEPNLDPQVELLFEEALLAIENEDEKLAFDLLLECATKSHARAQYEVGECYLYGYGTDENVALGIDWVKKSAKLGEGDAQNFLGESYLDGLHGIHQNEDLAIKWLTSAVNKRNISAEESLSKIYINKFKLNPESYELFSHLKELAEKSLSPLASNFLGDSYLNGWHVDKDIDIAIEWYYLASIGEIVEAVDSLKKLAQEKHSRAQDIVGSFFLDGEVVEQNLEVAFEWFMKAANQGYSKGQYNVGECYFNSWGVGKNESIAVDWYKSSADLDYSTAQNELGECYLYGRGIEMDTHKAIEWFKLAEKRTPERRGSPYARVNLGHCYFNGWGVIQDYDEAFKYYQESTFSLESKYHLGLCYLYGLGTGEDKFVACEYFRDVAERNKEHQYIPMAQFYMGYCYIMGWGVDQNDEMAVKWFMGASEQGHSEAQNQLGHCYLAGRGIEQDKLKAIELFKKSSDQGCVSAYESLYECNLNGWGVRKNNKEAAHWLKKSKEK